MARYCPSCNVVLTQSEQQSGRCPECGTQFAAPITTTPTAPTVPVTPETDPDAIRPPTPPGPAAKLLATALFVLTIGSFFLPWGMFQSMYTGFCKGGSVCACAGCTEKATETIEYGSLIDSQKVGYCKDHIRFAPKEITIQKGKSIGGLIAVLFVVVGPGLYLLWFLASLMAVYREEPNAMTYFVLYFLGGFVLLNLLSYGYWHYCHWALQYGGW
jgi:hypothetical protein